MLMSWAMCVYIVTVVAKEFAVKNLISYTALKQRTLFKKSFSKHAHTVSCFMYT